jgi:hypothetical protein
MKSKILSFITVYTARIYNTINCKEYGAYVCLRGLALNFTHGSFKRMVLRGWGLLNNRNGHCILIKFIQPRVFQHLVPLTVLWYLLKKRQLHLELMYTMVSVR